MKETAGIAFRVCVFRCEILILTNREAYTSGCHVKSTMPNVASTVELVSSGVSYYEKQSGECGTFIPTQF